MKRLHFAYMAAGLFTTGLTINAVKHDLANPNTLTKAAKATDVLSSVLVMGGFFPSACVALHGMFQEQRPQPQQPDAPQPQQPQQPDALQPQQPDTPQRPH